MSKKRMPPREIHSRDDHYMGMAFWAASKSKDPRTQIGAYILSGDGRPLGNGYNGPPKLINDNDIDWDRPEKYPYIRHAEKNAIKYSNLAGTGGLKGSTLYVTSHPCPGCMIDIVAEEIYRVVYFPYVGDSQSMQAAAEEFETTKEIAKTARMVLDEFRGNLNWMRDRIRVMEKMGIFD